MPRGRAWRRHIAVAFVWLSVSGLTPGPMSGAQEELHPKDVHRPPSADERALRALLDRYGQGDTAGAVADLAARTPAWTTAALDATAARLDTEIEYHLRPANRLTVGLDKRLLDRLRADRLQVLLLAAAIQLEASRLATDVDVIGWRILGAERAIDGLHGLRPDMRRNGPIPWPVAVREPPDEAVDESVTATSRADWPAIHAFVGRWYGAAVARLQQLVEMRLGPALIARGLSRSPGDPDLLLARGSYVETRVALARVDVSLDLLYSADQRRRWRGELRAAADDYARAMQAAVPRREAAIRLARIHQVDGRTASARDLLNLVLEEELPVHLRYLALVFRAAAAERSADLPAAIGDYTAALGHAPDATTPMLALSRIADEQQRSAQAVEWADRALAHGVTGRDPWRAYVQGQAWELDARIAGVRHLEPR